MHRWLYFATDQPLVCMWACCLTGHWTVLFEECYTDNVGKFFLFPPENHQSRGFVLCFVSKVHIISWTSNQPSVLVTYLSSLDRKSATVQQSLCFASNICHHILFIWASPSLLVTSLCFVLSREHWDFSLFSSPLNIYGPRSVHDENLRPRSSFP